MSRSSMSLSSSAISSGVFPSTISVSPGPSALPVAPPLAEPLVQPSPQIVRNSRVKAVLCHFQALVGLRDGSHHLFEALERPGHLPEAGNDVPDQKGRLLLVVHPVPEHLAAPPEDGQALFHPVVAEVHNVLDPEHLGIDGVGHPVHPLDLRLPREPAREDLVPGQASISMSKKHRSSIAEYYHGGWTSTTRAYALSVTAASTDFRRSVITFSRASLVS